MALPPYSLQQTTATLLKHLASGSLELQHVIAQSDGIVDGLANLLTSNAAVRPAAATFERFASSSL